MNLLLNESVENIFFICVVTFVLKKIMPQREKKLNNSVISFVETINDFFNDSPKNSTVQTNAISKKENVYKKSDWKSI